MAAVDTEPVELVAGAVEAAIQAAEDQLTAEARNDALAVATFYLGLRSKELPAALAASLTRSWMDAWLSEAATATLTVTPPYEEEDEDA